MSSFIHSAWRVRKAHELVFGDAPELLDGFDGIFASSLRFGLAEFEALVVVAAWLLVLSQLSGR